MFDMPAIETIQILKPFDGQEALYINGKLAAQSHRLNVEDVVEAFMSALGLAENTLTCLRPSEDELEETENGDMSFSDAVVWLNDDGCPEEWPFEINGVN